MKARHWFYAQLSVARPRRYEVRFRLRPPHVGERKVTIDAESPVVAMLEAAMRLDDDGIQHWECCGCVETTS